MVLPPIADEYQLLEQRLKVLLPEEYQESYQDVQPVSMGSAGLKFAPDGRVAWDEIWGSFCDLAMAGGPPHRGTLLEPATQAAIDLDPGRYQQVVDEICRGVEMVTGLAAEISRLPGWIDVDCPSTSMAGWLVRAITMENISTRAEGMVLSLPAGPGFRLEKEIKNVITSIAKTSHYWLGHTSVAQHRAIGDLFRIMESECPLIQTPPRSSQNDSPALAALRDAIATDIEARTGLAATGLAYQEWLGIECLQSRSAIWMMRVVVVSNVLCRREGTVIYVPVNPFTDPRGETVARVVDRSRRMANAQGIF